MDERADKRMLAEPAVEAAPSRPARARKGTPDAAFDLWLQRGLHAMYDDVAREPIPEELLRLIEQDRAQDPKK
ncbi:NepR family anti-sigma factor [Roseomonas sp. E05]|uniref:NepR family anti-sigma factor n=1 Tax=Roseomonas sp. E05 TaxID=3046310 RepID=UPI0024BBC5F8|nr:NepR family anti-sigma factor [Roseomonas sp. E05]MDJ0390173.1 NepR family anti-sigma factor [Roseomonas sp. E05]